MKRTTIVAAFLVMAVTSFSQTPKGGDNAAFLLRCQRLSDRMAAVDSVKAAPDDSIAAWRTERAAIKTEYKAVYAKRLTDDEAERYYAYTSQYKKRLATLKVNDMGEALNDAGDKMKAGAKRTGKKITGWFKGLK